MCYNIGMSSEKFEINLRGGAEVLQEMSKGIIKESGSKIESRARRIITSMSGGKDLSIDISAPAVGIISVGKRAIVKVEINYKNSRGRFIADTALKKSIDAGRIK